jgi:hypothetical protein
MNVELTKKEIEIIYEALYHEKKTFEFFRGFNPVVEDKEKRVSELVKKFNDKIREK